MPTVPKLASWGDAEAASYSFSTRPAGAEACSRADELAVDADGTGTWVRMRPGAQPAGAAVVQARRRMQKRSRATRNYTIRRRGFMACIYLVFFFNKIKGRILLIHDHSIAMDAVLETVPSADDFSSSRNSIKLSVSSGSTTYSDLLCRRM